MSRADGVIGARNLTLIDSLTNEVVDWVAVPRKRGYHPYGRRWIMLNQSEHTVELLKEGKLTDSDMTVLHALFVRLDFENVISLPMREVAEMTGKNTRSVRRSFKRLEDVGAIRRGQKNGNTQGWILNPNLGWKGKTGNLRREQSHLAIVPEGEPQRRWEETNPANNPPDRTGSE